jgi:hypothetical protein
MGGGRRGVGGTQGEVGGEDLMLHFNMALQRFGGDIK